MTTRAKTFVISLILFLSFLSFISLAVVIESSSAHGNTTCKSLHKQYDVIYKKAELAKNSLHKKGVKTPSEYERKRQKLENINAKISRIINRAFNHRCDTISWL